MTVEPIDQASATRLEVLTDEGLRLLFPLSAIYTALWPLLWVVVLGFDLPLARSTPATLWHPHEMLIGGFGAALIGFLTTAIPEFTDTRGLSPRHLLLLVGLWGLGRAVGVLGFDLLGSIGALADLGWIGGLLIYILLVSWQKRTTNLSGFVFWIGLLFLAEAVTRLGFLAGDFERAAAGVRIVGLVYLGLLGLALARIYVPVINLVLDPSEATSPYRPHPGRQNLASGLVAILVAAEVMALSAPVRGYLCIAAGAAFLDRAGEAFIGRRFFRGEVLALFASPAIAGLGLLLLGVSRLGGPLPEATGQHVALMGGLGLGVMAVFSIAGLLHTGQKLRFSRGAHIALALAALAVALRVAPEAMPVLPLPFDHLAASAFTWALAFVVWLWTYWPLLSDPATIGRDQR